jgi:DNA-binding response OmpR family regulator
MKILLVDDDPDESVIFRDAVEQMDVQCEISQVYYCHELYEALNKTSYDLIILDVNLPLVNGIECLKKLRADNSYKELPVVMYSNVINQLNIDLSYQNKADYFFIKPNSIEEIKLIVQKLLDMDWKRQEKADKESFLIQY